MMGTSPNPSSQALAKGQLCQKACLRKALPSCFLTFFCTSSKDFLLGVWWNDDAEKAKRDVGKMKFSHRSLHQVLDFPLPQYKELQVMLLPMQKPVEGQSVARHIDGHTRKVTDLTSSQRIWPLSQTTWTEITKSSLSNSVSRPRSPTHTSDPLSNRNATS